MPHMPQLILPLDVDTHPSSARVPCSQRIVVQLGLSSSSQPGTCRGTRAPAPSPARLGCKHLSACAMHTSHSHRLAWPASIGKLPVNSVLCNRRGMWRSAGNAPPFSLRKHPSIHKAYIPQSNVANLPHPKAPSSRCKLQLSCRAALTMQAMT